MTRVLAVVALSLGLAAPLEAQDWGFLPDGNIAVNTHLTTQASFSCSPVIYANYTCSASGQSVVFTSALSTLTVDFTGINEDLLLTTASRVIPIGTFTSQLTGVGPFLFRETPYNPHGDLFDIALNGFGIRFFGRADGSLLGGDLNPSYTLFDVGTPPPGYHYFGYVGAIEPVVIRPTTGSSTLSAQVALAALPEPSTFVLFASGLVLVGTGAYRRRRPT